jgi:MFS family permease
MLQRIKTIGDSYPRQFWLLLWGSLISSTGGAMIWPFLTIYLRERLDVPLTTITLLLTLNSLMGIGASFIAGPAADRIGRKRIMVISLFGGVLYYILMTQANSLPLYGVLIALWGGLNTLYPVGANAMVADLVPSEKRLDAYSLVRVVHNVGVAVGPIAGGFLAAVSYTSAFIAAAAAFGFFGIFILFFIHETLPAKVDVQQVVSPRSGYQLILKDTRFMAFSLFFAVTMMAAAIMFILLPLYGKENFGIQENQYGFIVTTNALMCIFVQYSVTQVTKHRPALPVLGIGALFYAVGVGSIALGTGFWSFVASMAVLTVGELIMTPTATALVAELAPADMRGRYMSIYGLVWPIGSGTGPIIAGFLSDQFAPVAMWYGGFVLGLIGAAGFFLMSRRAKASQPEIAEA